MTHGQDMVLNRAKEELPSISDITKAGDIELRKMTKNAVRSMEDFITQLEGLLHDQTQFEHLLCKLLGLDKELRSIWGSPKVETAKKSYG